VARLLFEIEKPELDWRVPLMLLPKHKAKLLMNMMLIGIGSVPRGGTVTVVVEGPQGQENFRVAAKGPRTLMPSGVAGLVAGTPDEGSVDARGIQPFYTGILARMTGMETKVSLEGEEFVFTATPAAQSAATAESAPYEAVDERSA
jgi:histidine phosphotransferase ChpT